MKLLVISNNPDRASFRQRIAIHRDALRNSGIGCQVVKLPSGSWSRRTLFKMAAEFDGVFLHKKALNPLDAAWLAKYAKKVIYDFDDAIMYAPQDPDRPGRKRRDAFRRTAKLADLVTAGNPYLADHARKFNNNVEVLPTGLDTSAYNLQLGHRSDGVIRLVWIGSKTTLRYLAGIRAALEQVGSQLDDVTLRIICDEFLDLDNMPVEKRKWSLQTQAADLGGCDIGLAPLPDNRFTRGKCGFKVLQYAAAGLPVVASPVGVNGDYVKDGITGFLATDDDQWIDCVTRLSESRRLRKTMAETAKIQAKEFDVAVLGTRLCDVIAKCLR
jgi:glycosyltransferase involved in cell wall biosynthesis